MLSAMSRHTPEGNWAKEIETNRALRAQVDRLQILPCPRVVQVHPLPAYERNMGVIPDGEERKRKRHRKRGDALFRAFPGMAEDLPVGHILSHVLTAMLRGVVPRPASLLESRAGLGVLAHAGSCWRMLAHAGSYRRRPVLHRGPRGPQSRPSSRQVHPSQRAT
jgi:hypothetical protein